MSAYMIVDVTQVQVEPRRARYREAVPASVAAAGGRALARGGDLESPGGIGRPGRIVVVECPSGAAAAAWWRSSGVAALCDDAITASFIAVHGDDGAAVGPDAPRSRAV